MRTKQVSCGFSWETVFPTHVYIYNNNNNDDDDDNDNNTWPQERDERELRRL